MESPLINYETVTNIMNVNQRVAFGSTEEASRLSSFICGNCYLGVGVLLPGINDIYSSSYYLARLSYLDSVEPIFSSSIKSSVAKHILK
jgi:hypothetical protein